MPTDLLLVTIGKAVAELAGLFLLGQGLLYVLAGRKREQNFFYQIFKVLTRPLLGVTRLVTPRAIIDRHIPFVAFVLLFWVWAGLVVAKIHLCATHNLVCT